MKGPTSPPPTDTPPDPEPQLEESIAKETTDDPIRIRYRIRFAKTGLLRWISHRDLARLWERLLRRANLKLSMTEGFHPKPRVSFPSALALGVESLDEVVEIELAEVWDANDLLEKLRADDQPGLTINRVDQLPPRFGKAQLESSDYRITIPESADRSEILAAIEQLKQKTTITLNRKQKDVTIDVASQVTSIELQDHELKMTLAASQSATLRPSDVLDLLGFDDWIEQGALISRTRVRLQREFDGELADEQEQR